MAAQKCMVTLVGADGIYHEVQVKAESVYEAALLALEALKKDSWIDAIAPGNRLRVAIRPPAVTHEITVDQLRRWADSSAITPADKVRKNRLRQLLASGRSHGTA